MAKPKVRPSFEINPHFKAVFVAGLMQGASLERRGADPTLMAAVDQVGKQAFAHLFSGEIVELGIMAECEHFFDEYWKTVVQEQPGRV